MKSWIYRRGLIWSYSMASICLWFYSFTQIDLNLTLSRVSIWQSVQKLFQQIGFYHRTESTILYLFILTLFFLLYGFTLHGVRMGRISTRTFWYIIAINTIVLLFSYPAFSYDIYNYLFTAKTVLLYHQNPYFIIPLELSGIDSWLNFMRWTHLPSAYTPMWILVSLPVYLLGFNYFLTELIIFKVFFAIVYILTTCLIWKILFKIDHKHTLLGTAIYALNPLVIIESVVSPHNDILMSLFMVGALYFLIYKQVLASFFILSLSIATKLMTIFLLPLLLIGWNRKIALFLMTIAVIIGFTQKELLPWYLLWILPIVALHPSGGEIIFVASSVSLGLLLRYAPYLYYGEYNEKVNYLRTLCFIIPSGISLMVVMVRIFRQKLNRYTPFAHP